MEHVHMGTVRAWWRFLRRVTVGCRACDGAACEGR